MSLQPQPIPPVPEDTARVMRAAFPKGNPYLRLRDDLGLFYTDERFRALFPSRGQPAEAPWRLAVVLVLQFAENLTDRQAADAVRSRIDWKYLLGLALTDPGFDYSVLSEFRSRLVAGAAEHTLLDALLEHCQAQQLLRAGGRQRTDATHVLGAIRVLNRLECVGEALRHALNALAEAAPGWLQTVVPAEWADRYVHRWESYRLPKGQAEQQALARTIGADGMALLAALAQPAAPPALRRLQAVEVLRQIWVQQFVVAEDRLRWRTEDELPPAALRIHSPYDPQARYGTKRTTTWVGYKVHLTESCDDALPHLVTQVETTIATSNDHQALPAIQADLAQRHLAPAEQLVDAGYTEAEHLVTSRQHGIDLVGPAPGTTDWQTQANQGYDHTAFQFNWEGQYAICPQGRRSRQWQARLDRQGRSLIRVTFAKADCLACPARRHCTRSAAAPRQLSVLPRPYYEALQAARARQQTAAFKARYAQRAGIEGTLSQGVRAFDLRRTRYVGHARTHLQHILIAVALNLVRLVAWFSGTPRVTTRPSPLARLFPATA